MFDENGCLKKSYKLQSIPVISDCLLKNMKSEGITIYVLFKLFLKNWPQASLLHSLLSIKPLPKYTFFLRSYWLTLGFVVHIILRQS